MFRKKINDSINYLFEFRTIIYVIVLLFSNSIQAQQCDSLVPTFFVDISSDIDSGFISVDTSRLGNCCGTSHPDKCIKFSLLLHPDAAGIQFDIYSGAMPSGSMFYQINCGPSVVVGESICLTGQGPHEITFCKPGNNINEYIIQSLPGHAVSDDIGINFGCSGNINAIGYQPGSINWTSIYPGSMGAYNNYLACDTCMSTSVTPVGAAPPYIDFEVSGLPYVTCDTMYASDTVRVYFYPEIDVVFNPIAPILCVGNSFASVTAQASGGTPPYSYLWSNGATTATVLLSEGTYSVAVGDTSLCPPTVDSVTIAVQPSPIVASAGNNSVICAENLPVTLAGTVINTTQYTWLGGNGIFLPGRNSLQVNYMPSQQEIANGFVDLYFNALGFANCVGDTDTVRIVINAFDAFITTNIQNVSCFGGNDGSASLTFAGGTPPFTVAWNSIGNPTGFSLNDLTASTISFTATDGNGCQSTMPVTINEPSLIQTNLSLTNPLCFAACNGTASAQVSGGIPPYNYLWSNGNSVSGNAALCSGNDVLIITDRNGCVDSASYTLTQPADIQININSIDVSCFGGADGAINLNVSGGNAPYNYQWSNAASTQNLNALTAGTYTVIVTDANLCSSTINVVINQASEIVSLLSNTNPLCNAVCNGTSFAQVSGGTPPYSVLWSNGANTFNNNFLCAGTSWFEVRDQNNCIATSYVNLTEPSALQAILVGSNETCPNSADGSLELTVSGGTVPYTYAWSTGASSSDLSSLNAGAYSVTVTDNNGCTTRISEVLDVIPDLQIISSNDTVVCPGIAVTIQANAVGGNGLPYTYHWNVASFTNQGPYSILANTDTCIQVFAEDANGCISETNSMCIEWHSLLSANLSRPDTICEGDMVSIRAFAQGGSEPYTYYWNNELLNTPVLSSVPSTYPNAAVYSMAVVDQCRQIVSDTAVIQFYETPIAIVDLENNTGCVPLEVLFQAQNSNSVNCMWSLNNHVVLNQCDNFSRTFEVPGNYNISLVVESADGCKSKNNAVDQIQVYPGAEAQFSVTPDLVDLSNPTYQFLNQSQFATDYIWNFGDGTFSTEYSPAHSFADTGWFNVSMIAYNMYNCPDTFELDVRVNESFVLFIPNSFTPNGDGTNEYFYPKGVGLDFEKYNLQVYNRWGDKVFESFDYRRYWDGTIRNTSAKAQEDVYVYMVQVFDQLGKAHILHGSVALIR